MKNKDINPYNDKGQAHGYWEWYYNNGNLYSKGKYLNRKEIGYWEWYKPQSGELWLKEYFI